MSRILSGVRPSGDLHLGNYLGALKQWVTLQNEGDHELTFLIVDLHSLDAYQDPAQLRAKTYESAALYLACGIDSVKSTIVVQSHVPAHTELAWILSARTPLGELERMTQYKEKSAKQGLQRASLALFAYPVLMAADILLYQADLVPVGDDQTQHLEFARGIAKRFNTLANTELFTVPERYAPKLGARVMSLSNPLKKMSKSDEDPRGSLPLLATNDVLHKNIARAMTDSGEEVRGGKEKPALANLLELFAALEGTSVSALEERYVGKGYGDFKADLAEAVIATIAPVRTKAQEYLADLPELDRILLEGAIRATTVAEKTLTAAKKHVGLLA